MRKKSFSAVSFLLDEVSSDDIITLYYPLQVIDLNNGDSNHDQ